MFILLNFAFIRENKLFIMVFWKILLTRLFKKNFRSSNCILQLHSLTFGIVKSNPISSFLATIVLRTDSRTDRRHSEFLDTFPHVKSKHICEGEEAAYRHSVFPPEKSSTEKQHSNIYVRVGLRGKHAFLLFRLEFL